MIEPDEIEIGESMPIPFLRSNDLFELIDKETLGNLLSFVGSYAFSKIRKNAVLSLKSRRDSGEPDSIVVPKTDLTLTFEGYGLYTLVFSSVVNGKKLSFRVRNEFDSIANPNHTQYITEFSRFVRLRSDEEVTTTLAKYGIKFPGLYLGSPELEIGEYIEGEMLSDKEANRIVPLIEQPLMDFLERMRKENNYTWGNTHLDINNVLGNPDGKNFIVGNDGSIFLIDPFTS